MKKLLVLMLAALVLGGCSGNSSTDTAAQQVVTDDQTNSNEGNKEVDNATEPNESANRTSSDPASTGTEGHSESDGNELNGSNSAVSKSPAKAPQATEAKQPVKSSSAQIMETAKLTDSYSFADTTGKYLILFSNTNDTKLNRAIGDGGKVLTIKYVKKQSANSNDDGRQWANNFDNMAGVIYEVVGGRAVPNETYYLVNNSKVNVRAVVPVTNKVKSVDASVKKSIEKLKSLKIENIWEISQFGKGNKVYVAQFKKKGTKVTASIILKNGSKFVTKDFVADYDPTSTWRVDDGGQIVPEAFSLLFAASTKQGSLLGVKWAGAEGENIYLLNQTAKTLAQLGQPGGRYMVP